MIYLNISIHLRHRNTSQDMKYPRTVTTLYKTSTCSRECISALKIASTEISINKHLKKMNAVVTTDCEFYAGSDCAEVEEELDEVMVVNVFKTKMQYVKCNDECTGEYCLVLVEMSEDIKFRESQGTPSFTIYNC